MNLQEMLTVIERRSGCQLNEEQKAVIAHGNGPLWVIAGPGSGKSEVLVLRCLKLTCIDKVAPKSIILTTFTEKAAKNIQDRLAVYKTYLDKDNPSLRSIDLFQVRVGTLHSLCNDIMQEFRYREYQNYRLLDDIDQSLFVYEHSVLASNRPTKELHLPLWIEFHHLAERYNRTGYQWRKTKDYLPHRWVRTNATVQLFNRMVEDQIDVSQMNVKGGIWETLATAYGTYQDSLEANKSCDFAHLQLKFANFLSSQYSNRFLKGDGSLDYPGIHHVLVDEYQDTNPIQEKIYLQLTQHSPHNLCVVGDDDQALYRFRGGTVECMVNFDRACQDAWGTQVKVARQPLSTNYRSHPEIISWCDKYICSFNVMTQPGARVAEKPTLLPDQQWKVLRVEQGAHPENYPAVSYLVGRTQKDIAKNFAEMVKGLLENGVINDPSQCVLLLRSTRVSPRSAGPYQEALEQQGFQVYNPRSRTFLEQSEIQTALGALVKILDPDEIVLSTMKGGVRSTIDTWLETYTGQAEQNSGLLNYVNSAINRIKQIPVNEIVTQSASKGATKSPATIQEIFYHMISLEPFATWQQDVEQTVRLGKLSKVLESYCSLPFSGYVGSTRGNLRTDRFEEGQINLAQLKHLYNSLVGLLVAEGLNDPENEEIICPVGRFPIMTVHQAKGLEFPFVFVSNMGVQEGQVGAELQLEDVMRSFRDDLSPSIFNAQERADQDWIRFFYVAYSRAIYSLILLTTTNELKKQGIGFGDYGRQWFTDEVQQLS
jgi:DNA helicase-2/ATP-dependent DNA helicase PcrA